MADTTNQRINYFDRQFLRAAEFSTQQNYHVDRQRRHARLLHTPGVAEGLAISGNIGDATVTIQPGTALDDQGRLIVLSTQQTYPLRAAAAAGNVSIYLAYAENADTPSTDPGITGTATRITESGVLSQVPPDSQPPDGVLLALLTLDANGKLGTLPSDNTKVGIDISTQTRAGTVVGDEFTVRSLTLKRDGVSPTQWPKLSCSQANQASLDLGGLTIAEGNLGIGTASPDRSLTIQNSTGSNYLNIRDGTGEVLLGVDATGAMLSVMTNHDLALRAGVNKEVMRLTAGGAVGVGTSTPDRSLTVANTTGANYMNVKDGTREILMGADATGGILSVMSNHDLIFRSGANHEFMRITAACNVGIGTTAPNALLEVAGPMRCTQWSAIQLFNSLAGPLPKTSAQFTTGGGSLIIFASGSGYSAAPVP